MNCWLEYWIINTPAKIMTGIEEFSGFAEKTSFWFELHSRGICGRMTRALTEELVSDPKAGDCPW